MSVCSALNRTGKIDSVSERNTRQMLGDGKVILKSIRTRVWFIYEETKHRVTTNFSHSAQFSFCSGGLQQGRTFNTRFSAHFAKKYFHKVQTRLIRFAQKQMESLLMFKLYGHFFRKPPNRLKQPSTELNWFGKLVDRTIKTPSLNASCLPEESSAMLLLKMLQPDEGIAALERILWGLAKASGVNRLVLLCVVLKGRYIAQCWCFISIMMTKSSHTPRGFSVWQLWNCLHGNTVFSISAVLGILHVWWKNKAILTICWYMLKWPIRLMTCRKGKLTMWCRVRKYISCHFHF